MISVAAVVLAGGSARRMGGGDKTLLPLRGRPMLAWVLDALRPLPVAISANGDPARFAAFGLPVLDDGAFAGQGPLAGVLAGLDWAATLGADAVLTVPGDTPLIPHDLVTRLSPPPACCASHGQAHHLVALWPVAARVALRAWLISDAPRRVERFGTTLGMRVVDFPVGTWDPFANANTPDDLLRLAAQAGDPQE